MLLLAYIDPGAGSLVIQAVIAGVLTLPFFFRSAMARSLRRLRALRPGGRRQD